MNDRDEWIRLPVQAVVVSDDDGSRPPRVDLDQFNYWVTFANQAFAGARIAFDFSPQRDTAFLRSSVLNIVLALSASTGAPGTTLVWRPVFLRNIFGA